MTLGRYTGTIDHLNALATVLDRHGVLAQFKADFPEAYIASAGTRAEFANLLPFKDTFEEGPPLRTR